MPAASDDELVYLPLGGAGEIGMNLYLYGFGPPAARRWLMVDLGVGFPGDFYPGADVMLPDIRFIEEERHRLEGIVLTHAHEDHYGAIADLWPRLQVPVYATPFTCAMLRAKLAHFGSVGRDRSNGRRNRKGAVPDTDIELREVALQSKLSLGPFDVEFVNMVHSIPEANGLIIKTPLATVFHTGDWKLDDAPILPLKQDEARLRALGDAGCDVLVCDSTNAVRSGESPSEQEVERNLTALIAAQPHRVGVTLFASNVARIITITRAAHAAGRQVVASGRAMQRVIAAAKETGYIPEDWRYLMEEDAARLPRNQVLVLCTGSQGEPRASLSRIAMKTHPRLSFVAGDSIIFSSKTIPGNERRVGFITNQLILHGINVISDPEAPIHVSGHPRRNELTRLYDWLKPKALVPMHGEALHLHAQQQLAREQGIVCDVRPVNGQMVRLAPGQPSAIMDEAPAGRILRDGKLLIDSDDRSLRDRRRLQGNGIVIISVALSGRGEVLADPHISLMGMPASDSKGENLVDILFDIVLAIIDGLPPARLRDHEAVRDAVRRAVRAEVNAIWGKRPECQVHIMAV